MSKVIETVQFTVKNSTNESDFLQNSQNLQAGFLSKQSGFLKRELGRTETGEWIDVVYWETAQDANKAAELAMQSEHCAPYFQMINESTMVMNHYAVMGEYESEK